MACSALTAGMNHGAASICCCCEWRRAQLERSQWAGLDTPSQTQQAVRGSGLLGNWRCAKLTVELTTNRASRKRRPTIHIPLKTSSRMHRCSSQSLDLSSFFRNSSFRYHTQRAQSRGKSKINSPEMPAAMHSYSCLVCSRADRKSLVMSHTAVRNGCAVDRLHNTVHFHAARWRTVYTTSRWRTDRQEKWTVECSPCARSRIPISRSHCPATFVSQTKSTHFMEENPNLLVVISAELRMLPNEQFCSPSLKRSSFLGNKGHVRDCLYQSMQFLPALSIVLLNCGAGLTITTDELENELAGRPTLNQRHRVLTYLRLGDRRPRKRTHCPGH